MIGKLRKSNIREAGNFFVTIRTAQVFRIQVPTCGKQNTRCNPVEHNTCISTGDLH